MSEGASSAPDAAVRLSMKRSSDSSHSESERKRLHTDHSTRDVVMLLDGVVKCVVGKMCLVDVNDWDFEFRDNLRVCGSDGATVACSSSGTTRELMSKNRVFSIFLLLPVMAMVICGGKTSGSVLVNTNVASWEQLGIAKNSIQFCSVVPRWRRRLHRQDGSLRRCSAIRCCGERVPCHSHQMGHSQQGSHDAPLLRARWVAQEFRGRCGDKREYFSETPDLALVKAVIAHAARRVRTLSWPCLTFGERISTLKRREEEQVVVRNTPSRAWGDELRKGLVSCNLTVGTVSRCCFHNELRSVAGTVHGDDIFVAGLRQDISKMGATLKERWETRDQMIGSKLGDQKEV